jgi:hypothetical protein
MHTDEAAMTASVASFLMTILLLVVRQVALPTDIATDMPAPRKPGLSVIARLLPAVA